MNDQLLPRAPIVVFVHGVWMTGVEFWPMRRRVARAGFATRRFHYRSLRLPIGANAARLAAFVNALDAPRVHLVCHSLGGLVALRMLQDHAPGAVGRVVLLGSPVQGSGVARRLAARPWTRWVIGASAADALVPAQPHEWRVPPGVGVVVGTVPFGVGRLLGGLQGPSDGTVAIAETALPGAGDVVHVRATHTSLPLSRVAARQVVQFLREGRFVHDAPG